eukprot:2047814-Amphidinium_carterae.1
MHRLADFDNVRRSRVAGRAIMEFVAKVSGLIDPEEGLTADPLWPANPTGGKITVIDCFSGEGGMLEAVTLMPGLASRIGTWHAYTARPEGQPICEMARRRGLNICQPRKVGRSDLVQLTASRVVIFDIP